MTTPETAVTGCRLTPPTASDPAHVPTYAADIAPILSRHCLGCHTRDTSGPFSLGQEAEVHKHGAMIAEVVGNGRMPPWYAASTHGRFANSLALPLAERDLVRRWFLGGMPSGDPRNLAPPRHPMAPGWWIGRPDLILETEELVRIPDRGTMPYQYLVLPHRFEQDTWVEAIEMRSEAPRVLHHCNLAVVPAGTAYDPKQFRSNYVPHGSPVQCEPGTAMRIPAGSVISLQAYYVPNARSQVDRLRVGLRFPRVPVQRELRLAVASNGSFEVPPGAMAHAVAASTMLPADAIGLHLFVHMHRRGRDARVLAAANDGSQQTLLLVPSYNFGGQQAYTWPRGGVALLQSTKISVLAHFDNSPWNPFNPDPTQTVRSGPAIADEQLCVSLLWVARDEQLGIVIEPKTGGRVAEPAKRAK